MLIYAAQSSTCCSAVCRHRRFVWGVKAAAYREDPLGVTLGPHVGVVDLLQDHPRLVVLPILPRKTRTTF